MDDTTEVSTDGTSASFDRSRERLMENVQDLANHADALLKATASVSSDGVALARRNLSESLQSVRMQLDYLQTAAIQQARKAAQVADTYVRRYPWHAVGIAAAAGVLVSLLGIFSSRRSIR